MTEKQYKTFERVVTGAVMLVAWAVAAAFLLGVYALANLVF